MPAGSEGFGNDPGFRIAGAVVVVERGIVDVVLVAACPFELPDDEHAASAVPAASAPSPRRTERRLSGTAFSSVVESGWWSSTAPLRASPVPLVYYLRG
ncbi:MAG: hypothetical protein ACLPVY_02040 [Acidimicrobiia bacterium]